MEQAEAGFRVRLEQLQDELRSAGSKAEELERHASERLAQAEAEREAADGIGNSSCTGLRSSMRKPASLLPITRSSCSPIWKQKKNVFVQTPS